LQKKLTQNKYFERVGFIPYTNNGYVKELLGLKVVITKDYFGVGIINEETQ
jgi:hypothetical protein